MDIIKLILSYIPTLIRMFSGAATKVAPKTKAVKSKGRRIEDIDSIKRWEALRLKAYMPTPHDVPTVGYGHTKGVKMGMVITEAQAEAYLREDLAWVRAAISKYVKVPLTQKQYDALASLIFNIGSGNFSTSTLLKRLNAGQYTRAADEFPKWNKQRQNGKMVALRGLTRRRKYERSKFLEGTNVG